MNTLVSIVMGIVLNVLGVEMQERKQLAQLEQQHANVCSTVSNNQLDTKTTCKGYTITSIKKEHKCKLSK